ncbi:hypothetical protein CASFOL_032534 [Castilleja foliolosa]|uniref:VQ domain-containing protein n=1 Tax=Castilleja foliolosa TaxID=1961234 RepID=A0ABD3C2L1_9LAMI
MASYKNLMTEQPWNFRSDFSEAWFSDEFAEEIGTHTAALQSSFSGDSSHGDVFSANIVDSLFCRPKPTVSGGSENKFVSSRQRSGGVPPTGRVAKRKQRGSKLSATTTFIVADPDNFRQMVQSVTGLRFGGLDEQPPVFKPGRINGVNWNGGLLPTLDTSDFILDGSSSCKVSPPPAAVLPDGRVGVATAAERLFDSVCSFPTLESWNM